MPNKSLHRPLKPLTRRQHDLQGITKMIQLPLVNPQISPRQRQNPRLPVTPYMYELPHRDPGGVHLVVAGALGVGGLGGVGVEPGVGPEGLEGDCVLEGEGAAEEGEELGGEAGGGEEVGDGWGVPGGGGGLGVVEEAAWGGICAWAVTRGQRD